MPRNTPQQKNAVVPCCSQSQGAPIARVTTSHSAASVNMKMHTPHRTMSSASSQSNARHLRWRWRCRIRARWCWSSAMAVSINQRAAPGAALPVHLRQLLYIAHELEDLNRLRPEIGRGFVLDRLRRLHEAALVDFLHHLDAERLELVAGFLFQLERHCGLALRHFIRGRLHPLLLLRRQAVPGLVADPDAVVVGLVLGDRQYRRHLVMLVREIDIDAVF